MVTRTQADDLAGLGPRLPGGVYVRGLTQRAYEVVVVYRGDEARAALGGTPAEWAIAVIDLDDELGEEIRVDRTAWDAARDYVISDPAR